MERFVGQVTIAEPSAFPALRQRGVLILANHQVQVESLLLPILLASALGRPVVTLADARHETRWLGQLARLIFSYPGVRTRTPSATSTRKIARPCSSWSRGSAGIWCRAAAR